MYYLLKLKKIEINQKTPEIVVDYPEVNVNDKIEIQNEKKPVEQKNEKQRDVIVNDKFEINQKMPDIVVDNPGVNVNDKIEIQNLKEKHPAINRVLGHIFFDFT